MFNYPGLVSWADRTATVVERSNSKERDYGRPADVSLPFMAASLVIRFAPALGCSDLQLR